ncbi:MAG: Holliday junction resolvase RuvX [Candidatus Margulisiibacteriota bacterium]|nr:Holliday junction resolvase RuvX [Candidatus Margulisiibacteriota bacterium]
MHKRLLGIDYGDVRIGLAISDPLGLTAQPVGTIQNTKTAINEIIDIIKQKRVEKIIMGLPKNKAGDDSLKATSVREFAKSLQDEYEIEIEFVDERFSTVAATKQLHGLNIKAKGQRKIIDTQAAMFFLQGVLDRKV